MYNITHAGNEKRQYLFLDTAHCIEMSEMLMAYTCFFG